jgi:hypothetical protein
LINLTEEQRESISKGISKLLDDGEAGLEGLWRKYSEWRKAAEGRPKNEAKTFPHARAANVAVPLTSVVHKTMYGALWAGLASRKPLIMAKPVQRGIPGAKEEADVITEYFEILSEDPGELGLRAFLQDWLNSACLLGVGSDRVVWDRREREVAATVSEPDGTTRDVKYLLVEHNGPKIIFTQQDDLVWDQAFQDLEKSRGVFERVVLSREAFEEGLADGTYVDGEAVLESLTTEEKDSDSDTRGRIGSERGDTGVIEVWEGAWREDVDGDGFYEDLLVTFHRETSTILAAEYNSYGERMRGTTAYEKRPGWVQGIGVGWACEHMQEVMNTLYNSRLDGLAITEVPVWLVRRGSKIPLNEDIWPGKRMVVDDPTDLTMLRNEYGFQNTREEERNVLFWAQKNTAASDTLAGFPDSVMRSSDTVGGQVLRLKQSSAMYQTVLENFEAGLGDIFRRVFKVLVMHKDEVLEKERAIGRMDEAKIAVLERALSIPLEQIPLKLRFIINTTDVDETFEMQRTNVMTMTQIMKLFFENALQLAQIQDAPEGAVGPNVRAAAASAAEVSTIFMKEVLKLFGHEEVDESLPNVKRLEFLRKWAEGAAAQMAQAAPGGMRMPPQAAAGGVGNGQQGVATGAGGGGASQGAGPQLGGGPGGGS